MQNKMAIIMDPTNPDYDELDPTCIILALAISISIFPIILTVVLMVVHHLPLVWTTMLPYYYAMLLGSSSSNSGSSSRGSSGHNSNSQRAARRGSAGNIAGNVGGAGNGNIGGGGGGRIKKKKIMTTTFRDLLLLYQGLIPAGYFAFPIWIFYHSIGSNISNKISGVGDNDGNHGGLVTGGGMYSFIIVLTIMGVCCHVGGKILSSYILLGLGGSGDGGDIGSGGSGGGGVHGCPRRTSEIAIGVEQNIVLQRRSRTKDNR